MEFFLFSFPFLSCYDHYVNVCSFLFSVFVRFIRVCAMAYHLFLDKFIKMRSIFQSNTNVTHAHAVRQYILHSGMLLLNEIELGLVSHRNSSTLTFGASLHTA